MKKDTLLALIAFIVVFVGSAFGSYYLFHVKKANAPVVIDNATTTPSTVNTNTHVAPLPAGYTNKVNLFYVALEDNGVKGKKIGCGDSIVPVSITVEATQSPLRVALEKIIADKSQTVAGYYNALKDTNFKLSSLALTNGVATVRLDGTLSLGGTCDAPRLKAQIEETARQFPSVKSVVVMINGKLIDQALSQK